MHVQSFDSTTVATAGGAAVQVGGTSSCLRMPPRLAKTPILVTRATDAIMYRASDAILRVAFNVAILSIHNGNLSLRSQ